MTHPHKNRRIVIAVTAALLAGAVGSVALRGAQASGVALQALSAEDIDAAKLSGELACGFAVDPQQTIMLAHGDVASKNPAQGIVKVNGAVKKVSAPGGFDAMIEGARFSGNGVSIVIKVTGEATGDGESPPRPATLTFAGMEGATNIEGQWTCGP